MYQFKVGDKILVKKSIEGNPSTLGLEGVIIYMDDMVGIEFFEKISGGHDCRKKGKFGYCFNLWENNLSIIHQYIELVGSNNYEIY
jgi:hypothetical protein